MQWETVIGLEVHVQLQTESKIFSGAANRYGADPNRQACGIDVALPGVLPVMNRQAAVMAARFGMAVNATVNTTSIFARKNYFYPDLPKGYQISQYEIPVVAWGALDIEGDHGPKTIRITRAHLEEDAGKSLHEDFHGMTGIDLNRAGTPLLEIVSEPDMRSSSEAVRYLRKLHTLVRYLDICDGNMQEGSFRCDANVSIRPAGATELGTRTELKNINSFRFVEQAIEFEIERQIDVLSGGGTVIQETRLYDPELNETRSMRGKEEAHDYRYFPDPDLPPLVLDDALLEEARQGIPELPDARQRRFESEHGLGTEDALKLISAKNIADFYENAAEEAGDYRMTANWVVGELAARLNRDGLDISASPVNAKALGGLLLRIKDDTISGKMAKEVFQTMWENGSDADTIIEQRGLRQITDSAAMAPIIDEVLARHPDQVAQYRDGQQKVFGFLVGQVMKATAGKANPKQVNSLLRARLDDGNG